jgi:hypothetical protein
VEGVAETKRYLEYLIKTLNVTIPEDPETHYEVTEGEGSVWEEIARDESENESEDEGDDTNN